MRSVRKDTDAGCLAETLNHFIKGFAWRDKTRTFAWNEAMHSNSLVDARAVCQFRVCMLGSMQFEVVDIMHNFCPNSLNIGAYVKCNIVCFFCITIGVCKLVHDAVLLLLFFFFFLQNFIDCCFTLSIYIRGNLHIYQSPTPASCQTLCVEKTGLFTVMVTHTTHMVWPYRK